MTELEWLKQESGLTDDELKTYETILGDNKFKSMLKKVIDANTTLTAAKAKAEGELEQFTTRYNSEFVPALRDVTQQAIDSDAKRAAAEAKLAKAKELGIVLGDEPVKEAPRAPGSPDPNMVTRDDFGQFQNRQANTLMALQDLNAEHFGLGQLSRGDDDDVMRDRGRDRLRHRPTELSGGQQQRPSRKSASVSERTRTCAAASRAGTTATSPQMPGLTQ